MQLYRIIFVIAVMLLLKMAPSVHAGSPSPDRSGTRMHPSWDLDGDAVNDCELDDTCDHTIDYSLPRTSPVTPSFDCKTAGLNSSETMVCGDPQLSVLDRKMDQVFGAARYKGYDTMLSTLRAEQRGWIKGRDACWKEADQRQCVYDSYLFRIAELQARYQLVRSVGPIHYVCGDSRVDEVVITYFHTLPPTLIAERGDSVSLMYKQSDGDQNRYQGRNGGLIIDGRIARLRWGYQAQEMICKESQGSHPD